MPPGPASAADGCLQTCPGCGALVDVSEQEPLAKIHCPLCGTAMRVSRQYNHFSIVETLGSGGMGAVYKALDRNLNRMVALKLLRRELSADDHYILKLEDEARITASINHPYVVKVFSFGSDRGQYYIAMELVDKGSLDDLMALQHTVSEVQVLQVGLQVASGLQAAHERGLIHRDVKPGNILFADAHTAKITDFGLALLAEHEAEGRGEIWGTPYYIAPEKLNNEPEDFRSDIYSLGGTLFHAVAGRPPFEAESASLVALKHLKSRAVSLQAFAPDVSSETAYVINRMLHKDPNQRYASYAELIDHLKYAADTVTANTSKPRAPKERVVVDADSGSNLAGLLTLVLLVTLILGAILAFVFRARLFHLAPGEPPALVDAGAGKEAALAAYAEARRQIAAQEFSTAQEALSGLAQRSDIPQPALTWIRLHLGMVALLNHQLSAARETFAGVQQAGPFSSQPADAKLAGFFAEASQLLAAPEPVPAEQIRTFRKDTFAAFGLLLFGLKDWEMGEFGTANELLTEFLAGRPDPTARWIADYAPIARARVHDYSLYAPLRARLDAKPTAPEERAQLRASFASTRAELKTTGKMPEAFYAAEADLKVGATSPDGAGTPAHSAAHEAEAGRWKTATDSYQRKLRGYRYEEALQALQAPRLTDPEWTEARARAVWRAQRLIAFKRTLIADLSVRGGYPQPVTTLRGVTFPQGVKTATSEAAAAATPYGSISIPWEDLAPRTVLQMANYFVGATSEARGSADRLWLASVFALENGYAPDARMMATQAARDRPDYQKEVTRFNDQ